MLQNRVYSLDKTGVPKTTSAGFPFAVYATAEDFTAEEGIISRPCLALATPRNLYERFTESEKDVTNCIKTFCNKRPFCFFVFVFGTTEAPMTSVNFMAYTST